VFILEPKYFFKACFLKKKSGEQAPVAIEETNPLFKIGDFVQTIADTTPGIDSRDSVSIYGCIAELEFSLPENSWRYRVQSIHDDRNRRWTPEARIRLVSVSVNDNCILSDTRGLKRRLSEERARNNTLKENYAELKSDLPVLEEEIRRLRRLNTKLKDKNEDLVDRSSELAFELRESTPSFLFSKTEPTGRNAKDIRARIQNIETPLKHRINNLETQISATKEDNRKLKLEVKRISSDNTSLKQEKKRAKEQIKTLSEIVEDLDQLEKEKESYIEKKSRLEEDKEIIQIILTGLSCRQAANQPSVDRGYVYINKMRQMVGWMQEIINACFLGSCSNIQQLGHDGGSISDVEILCVSAIITENDNLNPRHL
jgi:hypothetical protein